MPEGEKPITESFEEVSSEEKIDALVRKVRMEGLENTPQATGLFERLERTHAPILLELVNFLECQYGLKVLLLKDDVDIKKQVAEWNNGLLVMDIRMRGILGSIFMLAHIFGHLVQYASERDYSDLLSVFKGSGEPPYELSEEFYREYFEYEMEAFEYGKSLLERVMKIDQEIGELLTAFMYVDYDHYWQYLTTGESTSRPEFNRRWTEKYFGGIEDTIASKEIPEKIDRVHSDSIEVKVV